MLVDVGEGECEAGLHRARVDILPVIAGAMVAQTQGVKARAGVAGYDLEAMRNWREDGVRFS